MKFPARGVVLALALAAAPVGGTLVSAQNAPPAPPQTPAPATPAPPPGASQLRIDPSRVRPPRIVSRVTPEYTAEAMRARIEGIVTLRGVIERDGTMSNIEVVKSLGAQYGLDAAAVAAVRQWRFEPATLDGQPIRVAMTVNLEFHIAASPPMKRWPDGFDVEPPAGERISETAEVAGVRLQFTRAVDWAWTIPRSGNQQDGRWIVLRGPEAFDATIRRPQMSDTDLVWPVSAENLQRFAEAMRRSSPSGDNAQVLATGQVDSRGGTFWIWVALRLPTLPVPPGASADNTPFSEGRAWVFSHTQAGQSLTLSCTQLLPRGGSSAENDARIARAAAHCAAIVNSISITTK